MIFTPSICPPDVPGGRPLPHTQCLWVKPTWGWGMGSRQPKAEPSSSSSQAIPMVQDTPKSLWTFSIRSHIPGISKQGHRWESMGDHSPSSTLAKGATTCFPGQDPVSLGSVVPRHLHSTLTWNNRDSLKPTLLEGRRTHPISSLPGGLVPRRGRQLSPCLRPHREAKQLGPLSLTPQRQPAWRQQTQVRPPCAPLSWNQGGGGRVLACKPGVPPAGDKRESLWPLGRDPLTRKGLRRFLDKVFLKAAMACWCCCHKVPQMGATEFHSLSSGGQSQKSRCQPGRMPSSSCKVLTPSSGGWHFLPFLRCKHRPLQSLPVFRWPLSLCVLIQISLVL